MPTAQELGMVDNSEFGENLRVGDQLELSGLPKFSHSEKYNCEQVTIPTTEGLRGTTSSVIIGQLRSDKPKSVAGLLSQALEKKETLTVWVVEKQADTGRKGLALSIFKPRN